MDYLESVATRYQGEARVQRLLWIAQATSDAAVSAAAWTRLARHFRDAGNAHRTRDLVALLTALQTADDNHSSPASVAASAALRELDAVALASWVPTQEARNRQARDALQARLSQAQAHLHKDAIRAAYLALAEHELRVGPEPPTEAFHLVLRAKDYCVTRPQTASVSLQILEVALALKNYGSVREYVTKLEHTLDSGWGSGGAGSGSSGGAAAGAGVTSPGGTAGGSSGVPANWNELAFHRVKVASALEALSRGEFARAARVLVELVTGRPPSGGGGGPTSRPAASAALEPSGSGGGGADGGSSSDQSSGGASALSWPTVLCGEEVAVYTALLALAVLPRKDLLMLAEHADALEPAPILRECLRQFHRGQYTACWKSLPWDDQLALDTYLGPHVERLKSLVVQRAVLAYWQPYQRVELATMARELHGMVPDTDALLQHLVDAIGSCHSADWASAAANADKDAARGATGSGGAMAMAAPSLSESYAPSSAVASKLHDTRIDLPTRTLVRNAIEGDDHVLQVRAEAQVRRLTTQVLDDTYALVVRLACQEHGLGVATAVGGSDRPGGPRSGMGPAGPWNRRGGSGRRGGGAVPRRGRSGPQSLGGARGEANVLPAVRPAAGAEGAGGQGGPEDVDLDDAISSDEGDYQQDDEEELEDENDMVDVADDMNPEDLY